MYVIIQLQKFKPVYMYMHYSLKRVHKEENHSITSKSLLEFGHQNKVIRAVHSYCSGRS